MQSPRGSDLGLLPIPEHRRRRIRPLMIAGVVALVAGWLLDVGVTLGMGAGILIVSAVALFLDARARRRQLP